MLLKIMYLFYFSNLPSDVLIERKLLSNMELVSDGKKIKFIVL